VPAVRCIFATASTKAVPSIDLKWAVLFCILLFPGLALTQSQKTQFTDVTSKAGIDFKHNNGAFGEKYLPETMGPGCGFIDYDGDGWQDIVLINGTSWPDHPGPETTLKLYHNNHDGTFTDVTKEAGLDSPMFGMGVAVGDYDNDGHDDLFITAVGQDHLFRNNGDGTFTDVTKSAGLWGPQGFSASAAWIDYDHDGKLDLIVADYVQWSEKTDQFCTLDGIHKTYCMAGSYKGSSLRLWHNLGNGKFEDATEKAGLYDNSSTSLGISVLDYNDDGWPDIVVANDSQPNKLYVNKWNGTFDEQGEAAGIALSEQGMARAGMGIDAADYDRSGKPSIIITNFSDQMLALYHNDGNGIFTDIAPSSEVGRATQTTLGFGCFFFDYDNDGWEDIFVADGLIEADIEQIEKRISYAEPPHLFHNLGNGKFEEATASMGEAFSSPKVGRGVAYADIDNDGALDLLITTNGGPAYLFHNEGTTNHSLRIKLEGTKSNRDGIGAVVRLTAANGKQWKMLRSGSSYLSQSELVLTFGLGAALKADTVEVDWPSGRMSRFINVGADKTILVQERQESLILGLTTKRF
jgi:hypothetical protein